MNDTLKKFGYPDTLVTEYEHWCVLMRPAQPTLGALVLVHKGPETAFGDIPANAFAELATATAEIEASLKTFRPFERINYLMLMMVDPHVHFHVLPRYSTAQVFEGVSFPDVGWPGVPQLGSAIPPDADLRQALINALRAHWVREVASDR